MKKSIKHFCRLTALLILTSGILLTGCSNLFENIEDNAKLKADAKEVSIEEKGTAEIVLFVGLNKPESSESARTAMPFADKQQATTLTDIRFYAKLSSSSLVLGSNDTLLTSWESYKEMELNPYSRNLTAGTYDFMLTAKNYGATMTQTLEGKLLSSGSSTTLNFTSLKADSAGSQTGAVEINIEYNYVDEEYKKFVSQSSPYPVISISVDSNVIAKKESTEYSIVSKTSAVYDLLPDENGNTYEINYRKGYFLSAPITVGFHIVTFTFVAPDNSVFVYPIPVFIEAGYLSTNLYILEPFRYTNVSATQEAGVSKYTVTYNSNLNNGTTKTQDFYPGSSLADAEALGFAASGNKRFKEWNTQADGHGTTYKAGDTPEFTGNITLYAQWSEFKKVTYVINVNKSRTDYTPRTDTYIQQYEAGSRFVDEKAAFPAFVSAVNYSDDYTFCGWDTKADGNGKRYAAGAQEEITEDIVLYAMWCGGLETIHDGKEVYGIYNSKEWNAIMGAPFANQQEGVIEVNASIRNSGEYSIEESLTNTKTFKGYLIGGNIANTLSGVLFNTIDEGSVVTSFKLKGALCNENKGQVSDINISNMNMTGLAAIAKENSSTGEISNCTISDCTFKGNVNTDSIGAICYENDGMIKNVKVLNCTIDGAAANTKYTGGICGYNAGKIDMPKSGSTWVDGSDVSGVVKGKASGESYTGGFCGLNEGKIGGKGSVDITLSGSDDAAGYYGYVIGLSNDSNTVYVTGNITTSVQKTVLNTGTIEVDELSRWTITLTRTSRVTVTFTDTDENAAEIDGYFTEVAVTDKDDLKNKVHLISISDIKNISETESVYVKKGTYYVYLCEGYMGKNKGCSAKVVID